MKGCKSILRNCMLKESFGDLITNLHYTSVNPVHNAPVELPPARPPPPPPVLARRRITGSAWKNFPGTAHIDRQTL